MKKILISYLILLGLILCSCNSAMVPNGEKNEIDSTTSAVTEDCNQSTLTEHTPTEIESTSSTVLPEESEAITAEDDLVESESTNIPNLPEENDTTTEEIVGETIPSVGGDIAFLVIDDYTLYQKMIRSADLPNNFVYYEQIKNFGEFSDFTCHSVKSFTAYHYNFYTKSGENYMISITHAERNENIKAFEGTVPRNLRQIDLDDDAYGIKINDSTFFYVRGQLSAIIWKQNGASLVLYVDSILHLPASDLPPVLANLLDSTTAADALASIKASINAPVTE